jgi:hypothetical protein
LTCIDVVLGGWAIDLSLFLPAFCRVRDLHVWGLTSENAGLTLFGGRR